DTSASPRLLIRIIPLAAPRVHFFLRQPFRGPAGFRRPSRPRIEVPEPPVPLEAVDPGVPFQLAEVLGAELEGMAVALLQRVGALHDAAMGDAVGDREEVPRLVAQELERAAI